MGKNLNINFTVKKLLYSIVFVNYNSEYFILKCIESIRQRCHEQKYEILIVDNSNNNKFSMGDLSGCEYIPSGGNVGFGRACNIGVKKCKGERIVFVNPDIVFFGDVLKFFDSAFYKYGDGNIFGLNLVDGNGLPAISYGNFPSLVGELVQLSYLHKWVHFFYSKYAVGLKKTSINEIVEVDYVSGALFAIAKKTFIKLGGFSDEIFLYYEETELMYRHNKQGGKCYLICDAKAEHIGSAVICDGSDFKILNLEKGLKVFYKNRYNNILYTAVRVIRFVKLLMATLIRRKKIYLISFFK